MKVVTGDAAGFDRIQCGCDAGVERDDTGDGKVGELGGGADVSESHGTYRDAVLPLDGLSSAAALRDVAAQAAGIAFFIRSFHVNLEIQQVAEGGPIKAEEAFDEDDRAGGDWLSRFEARVGDEAVTRLFDGKAVLEAFDIANEEGSVEGIGMIEVECGAGGLGDVSEVEIVVIEGHGECVFEQLTSEAAGEFRLAGATGSGDANEEGPHAYGFCPVDKRRSRAASGMIFQLPLAVVGKLFFFL